MFGNCEPFSLDTSYSNGIIYYYDNINTFNDTPRRAFKLFIWQITRVPPGVQIKWMLAVAGLTPSVHR